MLEQIGRFIGMAAAEVVNLVRGRQAVPCLVERSDEAFVADDGCECDDRYDDPEGDFCCLTTDTLSEWVR